MDDISFIGGCTPFNGTLPTKSPPCRDGFMCMKDNKCISKLFVLPTKSPSCKDGFMCMKDNKCISKLLLQGILGQITEIFCDGTNYHCVNRICVITWKIQIYLDI